jgi:energy-converting hydrogenase Eha subunit E
MTGACTMPIAKILNLWDRTIGVSLMVMIAIMGLIMMAACKNVTTYCAAQVSALLTCISERDEN